MSGAPSSGGPHPVQPPLANGLGANSLPVAVSAIPLWEEDPQQFVETINPLIAAER